jgi:hypothetical protein
VLKTARIVTRRKTCPACGARTDRVRTPWALRWLKTLAGPTFSCRKCYACASWRGVTLAPPPPRAAPPLGLSPVVLLSDDRQRLASLTAGLIEQGHAVVALPRSITDLSRIRRYRPRLVLADDAEAWTGSVDFEHLRRALHPIAVAHVPADEVVRLVV